MTIQWGDTGKNVYGTLKSYTITVNPNENALGTVQNLGTAAPTGGAAGDISYTIKASDLPTITPSSFSTQYCAYLIICGQNNSGASVTLNYNVLKNGTSVVSNQTQTSVTNANYWTHSHYRWNNVQVGDTLEVQTWASASGVTLNYWAVVIYPTRMELTKSYIVKDLNIALSVPNFTKGNPSGASTSGFDLYFNTGNDFTGISTANFTIPAYSIALSINGHGLGSIDKGDRATGTSTSLSATYYPYNPQKNYYPSSVSFREILR